jgi:glycosyltransferase involved in cell wall biosynthesis
MKSNKSSIHVAFDVSSLYRHYRRHSGIPRFVGSLFQALELLDGIEITPFVNCTELGSRLDCRMLRSAVDRGDVAALYVSGRCDGINIRNNPPNIIHSTFYHPPDWLLKTCPNWIATVHDLRPIDDPGSVEGRHVHLFSRMSEVIRNHSSCVHCVSEFSASRVCALWGISPDRVSVIHPAVGLEGTQINGVHSAIVSLKPFVLFLGTIQPAKDVDTAIEAFSLATNDIDLRNTRLIIAGSDVQNEPSSHQWIKLLNSKRGIRLKSVCDSKRSALICAASAVLCTSRYEGFGFVPFESIALGSPPIISDAYPCLERINGWPFVFKSGDIEGCAATLKTVLMHPISAKSAVFSTANEISDWTWAKVASKFNELYRHTAGYSQINSFKDIQ